MLVRSNSVFLTISDVFIQQETFKLHHKDSILFDCKNDLQNLKPTYIKLSFKSFYWVNMDM